MKPNEHELKDTITDIIKSKPAKVALYTGVAVILIIGSTHLIRIVANFITECKNLNAAIKE